MYTIRKAVPADASRIAEIEIFNYRSFFYPIFKNDNYYFDELQVSAAAKALADHPQQLSNTYVYDDGVVKGFLRMKGTEVCKLFVEPVLQGQSIGSRLLEYAAANCSASSLWALEKNTRAIAFYRRHGFLPTGNRRLEEDTAEYLVELKR